MNLEQIRIILVRPSHPGNIGAAARAMKNMGFDQLYLVEPQNFPSPIADARASGAEDLLLSAVTCDSLDTALTGCHFVMTTTARQRSLQWDNYPPREAANVIITHASTKKIAIVFGPEKTGLSNHEIERSHCLIHIPVNPAFSSMNLASAVMLICYELRVAFLSRSENVILPKTPPSDEQSASADQVEGFIQHLHQIMLEVGFLTNKPADRLMRRIRRLFHRSRMTEQDINILRGILAGISTRIKE